MTERRTRAPRQSQRSRREWALRAVAALLVGTAGYLGVAQSLAYAMRSASPERAHALVPWDGRIMALFSEELSGAKATPNQRKQAERLATDALARDAMAVPAVATLGINAQIAGNTPAARRFFAYSDRLSRRDLRTRLWMIEDAVTRNDIPDALRNYDIALRTSRYASDILYPVLGGAISDLDIRQQLVRMLATKPSWAEGALTYIASTAEDSDALADLFIRLQHMKIPVAAYVSTLAIERLIAGGNVDKAWQYYGTIVPNINRRQSRDPDFRRLLDRPTPFDWVPVTDNPGVSASIQSTGHNGLFDFAVSPTVGGEVLRQMQLLPSGQYLLAGVSKGIDQAAAARPYWTISCLDGRELGRVDIPDSTTDSGRFAGTITVPQGCAGQYLKLVARPSNEVAGVTGQIEEVLLRPVD